MTGGPYDFQRSSLTGFVCVVCIQRGINHIHLPCSTGTLSMQLHDRGCSQCFSVSLIALGGRWENAVLCIHCSFHHLHICSASNQPWKGIYIFQLPQSFVEAIISSHLYSFNKLNYAYTHTHVPSYTAYGFSSATNSYSLT